MKKRYLLLFLPLALLLVGATGCDEQSSPASTGGSYQADANKVEQTQKLVQKSVPIPTITTSAERKNISARATLFDNENKTTYIYLISFGKVMAFYPVKGKVSSLNSYLSPVDKLVRADGSPCSTNQVGYNGTHTYEPCYVVGAPDIDGAYGENAGGIFFFTADTSAYVEWNDSYLVSDQPLKLSTQPELIRAIK